jgi:hypothetical protein
VSGADVKILNRDDIFAASDLPTVPVDVPEWGGRIFVRSLTAEEQDALQRSEQGMENINARLVAYCAVDENGGRLFVDADYAALAKKSAAAMARVVVAIGKLNATTLEAREEIAGN